MNTKQIEWPKWTKEYETLDQNAKKVRKYTVADWSWDWAGYLGSSFVSTLWTLATRIRKVKWAVKK